MTVPLAPCYDRVREGGFVRVDGHLWRLAARLGNGWAILDPIRIASAPAIGPNLYPTTTPQRTAAKPFGENPQATPRVWTCHTRTRPMGLRQCLSAIIRQLANDMKGHR